MDYDTMCGYWLKGVPYVWIGGKTHRECQRLYILDPRTRVFGIAGEARASDFYPYEYGYSLEFSRAAYTTLNMWQPGMKGLAPKCKWVSRYFRVYVPRRDGKLKDLDVRIEGRSATGVSPKKSDSPVEHRHRYPTYFLVKSERHYLQ